MGGPDKESVTKTTGKRNVDRKPKANEITFADPLHSGPGVLQATPTPSSSDQSTSHPSIQTGKEGKDSKKQSDHEATTILPRKTNGFDEILGPALAFFSGWGGPPQPEMFRARQRFGRDFIALSFPQPRVLGWYLSANQYDRAKNRAKSLLSKERKEGARLRAAFLLKAQ